MQKILWPGWAAVVAAKGFIRCNCYGCLLYLCRSFPCCRCRIGGGRGQAAGRSLYAQGRKKAAAAARIVKTPCFLARSKILLPGFMPEMLIKMQHFAVGVIL